MKSNTLRPNKPREPIRVGTGKKVLLHIPLAGGDVDDASNVTHFVRRCYEIERSLWESKKEGSRVLYRAPIRYEGASHTSKSEHDVTLGRKSEWLALANWCEERKIEPTEFIQLVFEHLQVDIRLPPEPAQLRSEKYWRMWEKYSTGLREDIATRLDTEKRSAESEIASHQVVGVAKEDSYSRVLMNRHVAISPLLRYCLAKSIGGLRFRQIAARFEPEAVMQFMRSRQQYAAVWKDVLPKGFAARAKRIYPNLVKALAE